MPRRKPGAGYAADTTVPVAQSKAQIETCLSRFKCSQYLVGVDHLTNRARVQFRAQDRIIRFEVSLPLPGSYRAEQRERQRWRQLLLVIKAKLEAVENNIATFEEEFLAHIVMPGDVLLVDLAQPVIAEAYRTGQLPDGLRALPAKGETA